MQNIVSISMLVGMLKPLLAIARVRKHKIQKWHVLLTSGAREVNMLSILLQTLLLAHTLLHNKLDRYASERSLSKVNLDILHKRSHQV